MAQDAEKDLTSNTTCIPTTMLRMPIPYRARASILSDSPNEFPLGSFPQYRKRRLHIAHTSTKYRTAARTMSKML